MPYMPPQTLTESGREPARAPFTTATEQGGRTAATGEETTKASTGSHPGTQCWLEGATGLAPSAMETRGPNFLD